MTKISSSQFEQDFKSGIKNDAAMQARLAKAGVDGKQLLGSADSNKDGKVDGAELKGLFKKIDDFDSDGSRQSVSGSKALGIIGALKGAPAVPVAPSAGLDLYSADPSTITRGAKGPDVKAAQEKLLKAGYELPKFGADGDFGSEMTAAVKQFQSESKLPMTGDLDAITMDKLNHAPATKNVQFPEYDKMFKDGVLQTTLGVGFDEDGNDVGLRRDLLDGLHERGFHKLDVKGQTDDQLRKQGFDPTTIDREATYYTKPFQHDGKTVQSLIKLVDRDTPDAKNKFGAGMKSDDLILYTGHGRRGSGPDFDHADTKDGNYVIGVPTEAGHYRLGANDIGKQGAVSNNYQLMFFDACNTNKYIDDLRSRPKNKDAGNLDVVASTRELPWSTSKNDVLGMLDGVMGGKSIQDIKGKLDAENAEAGKGAAFVADGFKGNTYRPAHTNL